MQHQQRQPYPTPDAPQHGKAWTRDTVEQYLDDQDVDVDEDHLETLIDDGAEYQERQAVQERLDWDDCPACVDEGHEDPSYAIWVEEDTRDAQYSHDAAERTERTLHVECRRGHDGQTFTYTEVVRE